MQPVRPQHDPKYTYGSQNDLKLCNDAQLKEKIKRRWNAKSVLAILSNKSEVRFTVMGITIQPRANKPKKK